MKIVIVRLALFSIIFFISSLALSQPLTGKVANSPSYYTGNNKCDFCHFISEQPFSPVSLYGGTQSGTAEICELENRIYSGKPKPVNSNVTAMSWIPLLLSNMSNKLEKFDGFKTMSKWQIRPDGYGGPGGNIWRTDLVVHNNSEGTVTLNSRVVGGERRASEITFHEVLPVAGVFAARIKVVGESYPPNMTSKKSNYSVKAFFTYTNIPGQDWPYCEHVENDFEIITEIDHPWYDENQALPQMTFTTHMNDASPQYCSFPLKYFKQPTGPRSIQDDNNKFITLVVRVIEMPSAGSKRKLKSEYYIIDSDDSLTYYNYTDTEHGRIVENVNAKFNNWWLWVEEGEERSYIGDQQLIVDWFYYNSNANLNPRVAHRRGQQLDD